MTDKDLYIPKHLAKLIVELEEVSYNEGIGPDTTELMKYIAKTYPDLKTKDNEWLQWEHWV